MLHAKLGQQGQGLKVEGGVGLRAFHPLFQWMAAGANTAPVQPRLLDIDPALRPAPCGADALRQSVCLDQPEKLVLGYLRPLPRAPVRSARLRPCDFRHSAPVSTPRYDFRLSVSRCTVPARCRRSLGGAFAKRFTGQPGGEAATDSSEGGPSAGGIKHRAVQPCTMG